MIVATSERAWIDRPLPRLRELLEIADRDFTARDQECRHVDGAFALRRRPPLVIERHRIARAIGAHRERTGGNFDEIRGLGRGLRLGAWGLRKNTRGR